MKKVIKSKIFLVIICGIIFTSLGVYAATTYKASDIVYNSSDGSSMNVEDALNELYDKKGTSKITKIADIGTIDTNVTPKPNYTYDIKKFSNNYSDLNINNFIVSISSFRGVTYSNTWADSIGNINRKYDSDTGILTISIVFDTNTGGYSVDLSNVVIYMIE